MIAMDMELNFSRRVCVFLVPTVNLVHQQANYFAANLSQTVKRYYGGTPGLDTVNIHSFLNLFILLVEWRVLETGM